MRFLLSFAVLLIALAMPREALAQNCNLSVTDMAFGTVAGIAGDTVDATATATVTCSSPQTMVACLHLGRGGGAGFAAGARQMTSGPATAGLELYADAARSDVWRTVGSYAGSQGTYPIYVTVGGTATVTIYGRATLGTGTPGLYMSPFTMADVVANYERANANPADDACDQTHSRTAMATFTTMLMTSAHCDVQVSSMDFGTRSLLNANIDVTGTLNVGCTNGTAYSVSLGDGLNPSAGQRRMAAGGVFIDYGMYLDPGRTSSWQGANTYGGTGTGAAVAVPIYGRVPPQANVVPNIYTDTVIVTVTY